MVARQQATGYAVWRLRSRVWLACGPARKFDPIEHQLAEWIESGEHASRSTRQSVERYLAGYLDEARDAGRRWGRTTGVALGIVIGVVAATVTLMVVR